ncbi:MAG: hypothetical protein M1568_04415 [Acidobacteria bacterium]|nr:hypothetical protein [Acidobacteriota bacterium]
MLTANEATLAGAVLGAILGGVVSFITARYILKHSANYAPQIADIHKSIEALTKTQEELRQQNAHALEVEEQRYIETERKAEAARWKPIVRIISRTEGKVQNNALRLESPQEFAIIQVSLISPGKVRLHDYQVPGAKFGARGFSVPITHESLQLLTRNNQQYFDTETFEGALAYSVVRSMDGSMYEGELPFHGRGILVGNTGFYMLVG